MALIWAREPSRHCLNTAAATQSRRDLGLGDTADAVSRAGTKAGKERGLHTSPALGRGHIGSTPSVKDTVS